MRERAAAWWVGQPWGRHQWDRLADGEQFDGMESWLPWLVDGEELLCDLLGDDALVVLVEPRRVRDRAGELLDEESALADALAATWGLDDGADAPRLHVPFDRLLTGTPGRRGLAGAHGRGPGRARWWRAGGGSPSWVTGPGWPPRSPTLVGAGYSVVLCSSTAGGAERLSRHPGRRGRHRAGGAHGAAGTRRRTGRRPRRPGARIVVAAVDRGFVLPGAGWPC